MSIPLLGNIKNALKAVYLARRYETLIRYLNAYHREFQYGKYESHPCVRFNGRTFVGFEMTTSDASIYRAIARALPADMDGDVYRIARDIVTRDVFPHMIPYLKPLNRGYATMSGFHGQHKDTIYDIEDLVLRDKLTDLFLFRHDDVVLNCGAYTGYGDMRLSDYIPNGMIYALEAKRECFEALTRNLAINEIKNVVPLHNAVWCRDETIDLNTGELQTNSLVLDAKYFDPNDAENSKEIVRAIRLDTLVREQGIKKVDFISLTLNGAEVEAIDGMKEILANFSPRIRLAGWYFRDKVPVAELCAEKLKKHGYRVVIGKYRSVYAFKA